MTLLTETAAVNEWIVVEGVSLTFLGTIKIKIGDVELPAFIEGRNAQVRCPNIGVGRFAVRVDGKKVGDLQIV